MRTRLQFVWGFLALALLVGTDILMLLCATPVASAAAQQPNYSKIGILTDAMVPWHSSTEGFRDGLKEFGYVEGKNLVFEVRSTQGDPTRLPRLAAELMDLKLNLLFCVSDACAKEIQVPVVFTQVSDPVRLGLVESIARPGRDITGIANLRAELSAKRVELFTDTVPSLRRVLITYDRRQTEEREAVVSARGEAKRRGLVLLEQTITMPLEIEPGLSKLEEGGRDGILIVQSGTNLNIPGRSLQVATSNKIPTMYPASFWTQYGALVSYGPDQYSQGRQAARLAHRILTGTPARELPVELPDRIEYIINLKTASRIGLQIPPSVLYRANRVLK